MKKPTSLSTGEVQARHREALAALDLLCRELLTSNAVVGRGTHAIVFDRSGMAPELLAAITSKNTIALYPPDIGFWLPIFSVTSDNKHICLTVTDLLSDNNIARFPILQQLKGLVSRIPVDCTLDSIPTDISNRIHAAFDQHFLNMCEPVEDTELSTEELALVRQSRAEQAQRDAAQAFQRKAIATAHAFNVWSATTGEGLTVSTFINTFGYQDEDGKQMYEAVKRILDAAWPQA